MKWKRTGHLLLFLIGIFDLIVIARTRSTTLIILVCLAAMVMMDTTTKRTLRQKILLCVFMLFLIFGTDVVSNFIDSFSLTSKRAYSTTARLYAANYYMNYFIHHPLFGFGFADYIGHYNLIHGDGRAIMSDVGIFGQLAKYGLFLIPIYILPLIRSCRIMRKMWKDQHFKNKMLYLALTLYIVATTFNLIAIDQFRFLLWPVYLVIMEFGYWEYLTGCNQDAV